MENKLEYTAVYKEFSILFEKHIEGIIEKCEVGVEEFFNALSSVVEKDADNKFYLEVLLSVTDFSNFMDMMKSYKREHAKPKEE
jgi:hypothetical protein